MVYDAFARASIGHGRTGVAYLKIYNQTDQSDYLINVKSNIAEKSELHTHFHENGIMKMLVTVNNLFGKFFFYLKKVTESKASKIKTEKYI